MRLISRRCVSSRCSRRDERAPAGQNSCIYPAYSKHRQAYLFMSLNCCFMMSSQTHITTFGALCNFLSHTQKFDTQTRDFNDDRYKLAANATIKLCLLFLGDSKTTYDDVYQVYIEVWTFTGQKGIRLAEMEQLEFLEDLYEMAWEKSLNYSLQNPQ